MSNQPHSNLQKLSDSELYDLSRTYGKNALTWRAKFLGTLPEINQRRLYEKKGFESIFHYAKVLAGVSEAQVRRVLNIEKRLIDKPSLKNALTNGEVSINKLARVVSIATPENEEELCLKTKQLSQKALQTFVNDINNESKSVRAHKLIGEAEASFQLSEEAAELLSELDEKGLDANQIIIDLLKKRTAEIEKEKEEIGEEITETNSRYIAVKIRKIIKKEHGNKCSKPGCSKEAKHLHHTLAFAISKRHDPRYLAPLCKEHHQIAHTVNLNVQKRRQFS